jgi:hypothetical protein
MQTQLPLFSGDTILINMTLGYMEQEDFRYYVHNGNPIYCHAIEDKNSYRFIIGNLITHQLCSITELTEALGEHRKNIERYAKTFREKGTSHNISEAAIRYHLNKGTLKKLNTLSGSHPVERNKLYSSRYAGLGMAATRVEERVSCALGLGVVRSTTFESSHSIPMGGVMLRLPFLLESGLLSY